MTRFRLQRKANPVQVAELLISDTIMNVLRLPLVLGIICPFVFLARIPSILRTRKAFIQEYFENCDDKLPARFENFSSIRNGSSLIINVEEIMDRDFKNPISIRIRLERCKDKSNLNACEYFTTLKWDDICLAVQLVPFLKSMFEKTIPPSSCPLKKGQYHVKDAKVSLDSLAAFLAQGSGSESLLKIRYTVFEAGELIACINAGVRIKDVRIRVRP